MRLPRNGNGCWYKLELMINLEIYRLQSDFGAFLALKPAAIYGAGPNAILGTCDPDSGWRLRRRLLVVRQNRPS